MFTKILKSTNLARKINLSRVFDDVIADMIRKQKNVSNSNWLTCYRKKTKYFSCFWHSILLYCSENFRLNSTHYLVTKITSKKELQQIAFNHSSDMDFQDFMNL